MKYKKTEAGQLAVKERSALLSSRQRSLLIMVDGQKEMADLVRTVTGLGGTVDDVNVFEVVLACTANANETVGQVLGSMKGPTL